MKIFSNLYKRIIGIRNNNYDINKKEIYKCSVPVISIGNLSVGGTGKTPFVQMLANILIEMGIKPGIIGRGYKRESKGEIIVSDGQKILTDALKGGDEMVLLAQYLNAPVIANDDKTEAAKTMVKKFDVDCIIADDAFQHRKLHRDLDIVLIDKETNDNPEVLPKGRLREPLSSLKRADIVCLAGNFEPSEELLKNIEPETLTIRIKSVQGDPYSIINKKVYKPEEMTGIRNSAIAFCGIAKPYRFFQMLKEKNYNLLWTLKFPDHHRYSMKDMEKILSVCKRNRTLNIFTTEKDATKISRFNSFFKKNNIYCFVFPILPNIIQNKNEFNDILKVMFNKIDKPNENVL